MPSASNVFVGCLGADALFHGGNGGHRHLLVNTFYDLNDLEGVWNLLKVHEEVLHALVKDGMISGEVVFDPRDL